MMGQCLYMLLENAEDRDWFHHLRFTVIIRHAAKTKLELQLQQSVENESDLRTF